MPSVPKYFLVIGRTVVEAKPARQHADSSQTVIPAKAGIHVVAVNVKMDPRFRGDDECGGYAFCDERRWIPAFAGMTNVAGTRFVTNAAGAPLGRSSKLRPSGSLSRGRRPTW